MGWTDGRPKNMMFTAIAVVGEEAKKQRFQSFLSSGRFRLLSYKKHILID